MMRSDYLDRLQRYKAHLIPLYAPASVNSMLAAVNGFLDWMGMSNCTVKPLKVQSDIFSKPEKELSQREYQRLIQTRLFCSR